MKHQSLPQSLTPELLASWLVQNAKEKFTDDQKHYYNEDELIDLKDAAVKAGIEVNKLIALKGRIAKLLEKGCDEYESLEIYETRGIGALKNIREKNETKVELGYELIQKEVFGIPNQDTRNMDYFDIEGNQIIERTRPLSTKEIREYLGQFLLPLNEKQA